MIIPVNTGEQYFLLPGKSSKKEIEEYIVRKRKMIGYIVSGAIATVGISMYVFILPQITELYTKFNSPLPVYTQMSPIISVVLGIIAFFFLNNIYSQVPDYTTVNTNEGRIKVSIVQDAKTVLLIFIILGIAVGILTMMYIVPIYSLTERL